MYQVRVGDKMGVLLGELEGDINQITWRMNDISNFSIRLSKQDAKVAETLLQYGNRIIVEFDNGLPAWGGMIDTPRTWGSSEVEVTAYSADYILKYAITNRGVYFTDASVGYIFQRAIDIASKAFEHALGTVREGSLENDIAQEMEFSMKRNGAENLGFDIIVASGTRSALPHGRASTKRVEKGDFILFDYGCRALGYHSDETITVVFGEPSEEQRKVYQIVKDAHDKAIETVRPGIPLNRVDAAARDYIRNFGYGDCFGHGLGHGVGLAVHEDPTVNADNRGVVREGMVFTIEPGIYIPDWGGVRIEDMVRVTAQGAEVLTHLSKELRVI